MKTEPGVIKTPQTQIMVVEDEGIVAMEIQSRLRSLGYGVCAVVDSGELAVQKAAETQPDLILMDIRLKGAIDGVAAAAQIRASFDIPLVYLTAYSDEHTLQRAKVSEPFGYLLKPFEERELHTTIEMALYRHRLERKLRESERWLTTTLHSIGDGVIATDGQGRITFINPVAETLTGWWQTDAIGRELTEVFHIVNEETRALTESPVTKALREGVIVGLANHTLLISKDGLERPIEDSAAPIRDEQGNVSGVVLVFRDITERKRVESEIRQRNREAEALRQAGAALSSTLNYEEVLDRILEQVGQVVPHHAADLMLIEGGIARIFRWRGYAQFGGVDFATTASFNIADTRSLRTMQETGQPLAIAEVDAYAQWVNWPQTAWIKSYAGAPISIRDQVIGFLNVCSATPGFYGRADAERLQAFAYQAASAIENARLHENLWAQLDTLEKAQARLVQSEKLASIGQMVAGVAHELNNPLTTIIGFAQLLQLSGASPAAESDLNKIVMEAQRAAGIVRGLLDFARQRPPEQKPVQINDVLHSTLGLLAYELRTHNIKVTPAFSPSLPLTMADPHQLQQVFVNLINNARHALSASHNGGHLTITSELGPAIFSHRQLDAAPVIRITIQDDGPGIPPEQLARIFDPFFTTKAVGEGTGLGLSVCHGIISEHGGHIWAESEPGQGATFLVELPVDRPKELRPLRVAEPVSQAKPTGAARILVIDDEVGIQEMVTLALNGAGYHVDAVPDGEMGLAYLAKADYDLILCDMRMPGLSGLQVHQQVQAQKPDLARRIIFTTGDTVSPATHRFLNETGSSYLAKPFGLTDLLERVGSALETSHAQPG